jgi:hypothetical protein
MEKKKTLGLALLFLALVVVGGGIYYLYTQREEDVLEETPDDTVVVEEEKSYDNLNLEYEYLGDNTWQYTVTGTLPNPCYEVETEAIVAESLPEQVTIRSIVTPPDEDEICAEVIQEVSEEGQFQASEEAAIIFERQ